jgi:hypothetical protein
MVKASGGLYYKQAMILNNASRVTLQIVASLLEHILRF